MLNLDLIRFAKLVSGYLLTPQSFIQISKFECGTLTTESVGFSET